MWQTVRTGNENYIVNVQNDNRNRKFLVYTYAFEALWDSEVSYVEIVNEMKQLNEFLEFDEEELISEMIDLFKAGRTDVHWNIKREADQLELHLTSTQENIKYSFNAILHPSDSFLTNRMFVLPLIIKMKAMTEQLKRKDVELLEHKMNGSTITRKNIETPVFEENSFDISPQSVDAILSNTKDLFDGSMITFFNQIQPVIWERLFENHEVQKESPVRPKRKLNHSSSAPVSQKITTEPPQKKEEKIRNMMFHKMNSIKSQRSRPARKLEGL